MNIKNKAELAAQNINHALQTIIENGLCSGCGACAGVCPQGAINIDYPRSYQPIIQLSKCACCNLCYEVCPGKGWPAVSWAAKLCDDAGTKMHPKFGPLRNVSLGRSTNSEIHLNGASGGVATSLLLYLLAAKEVDAVAVVALENGYPVLRITDDPEEVISCSGSKYSPVPIVEHVIKRLKESSCRIAMTVIPCHLAALHYALERDKRLAGKIVFTIGLFCGDLKDYESVYRIADSLGLKYPQEAEFRGWRCGHWPGAARFELKDGSFRERPLRPWLGLSIPFYALHRCLMCPAGENWLADMALADNHAGATSDTIILARTEKGHRLLCQAKEKGFIDLIDVDDRKADEIVIKTKFLLSFAYIQWRKRKGYPVPVYDYENGKDGMLFHSCWIFRHLHLLKYRLFIWVRKERILNFLIVWPSLMEKVGKSLNKFPFAIPLLWPAARFIKRSLAFLGVGVKSSTLGNTNNR